MPKVSIITPTYNGERFIGRAIRSVLWQTFQDWEMIVVDDGSNDKTPEIVEKFMEQDKRIKLIRLKENSGGPALPRTIAGKEAKGEYIAFLDQDDIFYPEYLELKVKYLNDHPEIDILYSMAWAFDEETKKIINYELGGPVNLMIRKNVLEDGGYFKKEQNGVDEIGMLYRYFLKQKGNYHKQVFLTKEPITLYSRHPQQGSYVENKDPSKFVKRIESLLEEFNFETAKDYLPDLVKIRSIWHSRLGNFYALAGDFAKAKYCFLQSLKLRFNLFSLVFLLIVLICKDNYKVIEYTLRQFQRKILWRVKVLFYRLKFSKSYQKAQQILKSS